MVDVTFKEMRAIAMRKEVGIPDRPGTIEDVYLYEEYLQVSIVVIGARADNQNVYPGHT